MPSILAVASTMGLSSPGSWSLSSSPVRVGGGQATPMLAGFTPATMAGTASITRVENSTAVPPGTYSPTFSIGSQRMPSSAPSTFTAPGSVGITCC